MAQQQMSDGKSLLGTVKWFNTARGYGFITVEDGNGGGNGNGGGGNQGGGRFDSQKKYSKDGRDSQKAEIFFHISEFNSSKGYTKPGEEKQGPREGQRVKFQIETKEDRMTGKKRTSAVNIWEEE